MHFKYNPSCKAVRMEYLNTLTHRTCSDLTWIKVRVSRLGVENLAEWMSCASQQVLSATFVCVSGADCCVIAMQYSCDVVYK